MSDEAKIELEIVEMVEINPETAGTEEASANRISDALEGAEGEAEDNVAPPPKRSLDQVVADLRGSGRNPAQLLEALLFSTHMPLTKGEIGESLGWEEGVVEHAFTALEQELLRRGTPLGIFSRSKEKGPGGRMGFILDVKASYRRSIPTGRPAIPQSLTETLALIALNQPIPQSRLVRERGSTVYEHVKELLKKGWIERRKFGRSYELRTTEAFAAEFGLENEPELIKRALARAAGVQGQPEVIGSKRVQFDVDSEGGLDLVSEAREFVPSTPELAAPVVGAVVTPDAVEQAIAAVEAAAAELPEAQADCVVSGGGIETASAGAVDAIDSLAPAPTPAATPVPQADCLIEVGPQPKPVQEETMSQAEQPTSEPEETSEKKRLISTDRFNRNTDLLSLLGDDDDGDDW